MSANVEAMVREGVNAFKAGKKDEARILLSKAVELDPYNEEGWLWLSGVVTSVDDQRTCLENVLAIDPNNSRARSGLDYLIKQNPSLAIEPPSPLPAAPLTVPEVTAASSVGSGPQDSPTSVEWAAPADEEPLDDSGWHDATPSSTDSYDEWVTGLQLGAPAPAPVPRSDPFASPAGGASPFYGSDEDLAELTGGADLFSDSAAFGAAVAFSAPAPDSGAPQPDSPAISFRPPPVDDDDDLMAPAPAEVPAPAAPSAAPAAITAAGLADMDIDEHEVLLTEDEAALFPEIPREVKATRLPGTHEGGPLLLKLAVFLLAVLTLGTGALFFWQVL
jgi:hypothetical protein